MAKNERFDDTITIRIKGRSTNRFVPNMLGDMLTQMVKMINITYQQTDATIEITRDATVKRRKLFGRK